MSGRRKFMWAVALVSLAGCADRDVSAPLLGESDESRAASVALSAGVIDISGEWVWSQELVLILPAWAAEQFFGIQPEGATTHSRCTGSGTMMLVQTGDSFSGSSQSTAGQCVTRGGQVFAGVGAGIPQPIVDGKIQGRSLAFHRLGAGGSVDCLYHAVISLTGSLATELAGGGPCVVPGHPKSTVPLDPPPGGTQTVLSWTAVRG